jgi:hypothetical protein
VTFTCPCCGYPDLSVAPFALLTDPIPPPNAAPPYSSTLGGASFEICSCCGFEFGFDDDAGASGHTTSFEDHREDWLERGAPWFSPTRRPPGWDVDEQLAAAGFVPTRLDRLGSMVAAALAELLDAGGDDRDLLLDQHIEPGSTLQRLGAALDRLLNGVLRAAHDWDEFTDGLLLLRCRRIGVRRVELVAMWHVGLWDDTAESPHLVPVRIVVDLTPTGDQIATLAASVGEVDPSSGSAITYRNGTRAADHRLVTILDDLDTIAWTFEVEWP